MMDEKALQNLAQTPFSEMRPDFTNGVTTVRKKIIQKMKPKKLNGKNLNGDMLYNLAQNYVEAINNGAVPNIETAWTYICQSECLKASQKSTDNFEQEMQERFEQESPFSAENLDSLFKELKARSLKMFKKVAVGDNIEQYEAEIKQRMKKKYEQLKQENERNVDMVWNNHLIQNYSSIQQMLQENQYQSFEAFLGDIQQFIAFMQQQPPIDANGDKIIYGFVAEQI